MLYVEPLRFTLVSAAEMVRRLCPTENAAG